MERIRLISLGCVLYECCCLFGRDNRLVINFYFLFQSTWIVSNTISFEIESNDQYKDIASTDDFLQCFECTPCKLLSQLRHFWHIQKYVLHENSYFSENKSHFIHKRSIYSFILEKTKKRKKEIKKLFIIERFLLETDLDGCFAFRRFVLLSNTISSKTQEITSQSNYYDKIYMKFLNILLTLSV